MVSRQSQPPKQSGRGRIAAHVGNQIRAHRLAAGFTQVRLAEDIGIGTQLLQKYEHGASSISVDCLTDIARILGVPIEEFFLREP